MLQLDAIETGSRVTHKNTGLRYTVADLGEEEVLLSPDNAEFQDLLVPAAERPAAAGPAGPKTRGRIKKMVRDRGFGFIRGEDGKEVFFHRSGLNAGDYDALNEGDSVEYVVQEGPRGARAESVRAVTDAPATA